MSYYDHFALPFLIGVAVLFSVVLYKYIRWIVLLPKSDKQLIRKGLFTFKSISAVGEVFMESLLHRRIFRTNPLLGYMHMSLAFGWFLLIIFGWMETVAYLGAEMVPPHTHVFFKYFSTSLVHPSPSTFNFSFVMDLLLLFVLTGVALAWAKRLRSKMLGMRKTTRHSWGDRLALSTLWFIFPARLIAESVTSGIHETGSFLTGSIGQWAVETFGSATLIAFQPYAWWFYSIVLGLFFVAMPFSRYMHIFTEVPLIFLRHYNLHSTEKSSSFDQFQVQACSRCGICIDPCQLQSAAGIKNVQSVYFLRDRRYGHLTDEVAGNCLMCGRCEAACPVGIELNTLRLNSRDKLLNTIADGRYAYLTGVDTSSGEGKVGYFAGCMTLLTPRILKSMEQIFDASGDQVWWADREGGVCCGRPLKLSGEVDAAQKMIDYNRNLFTKHGITTLVTSCPICLRVFKEEYQLKGIEVLHHSEYIKRLIETGRINPKQTSATYTYHDPCELGRGSGIYEPPREVISSIGELIEMPDNRSGALCCGSSIANTTISDEGQNRISASLSKELSGTGADAVVTACPLCKKAIARNSEQPVYDLSEIVASSL